MGWALGGFGIFIVLLIAAGATVVICKRYSVGWQCHPRDVWIICEEWRRKLSWLWAPREEKVGLVKAQQPTAHAVPGLYRQSSSGSSQYILHSDSDLRLDAQGAFTRFEVVDRDLQPPTSPTGLQQQQQQQQQNASQASSIPPQPLRPAPQPRATPRPRPSPLRADYLRLRECEPSPPTPPPPPAPSKYPRGVFLFQEAPPPLPPPPPALARALAHNDFGLTFTEADRQLGLLSQDPLETMKIRYSVQGAALSEPLFDSKDSELANDRPFGSYEIVHERPNYDSIFGPQNTYTMRRVPSTRNLHDLERISRYIQSLPDEPDEPPCSPRVNFFRDRDEQEEGEQEDETEESEPASPAAPPPPAPPDPSPIPSKSHSPEPETTGEKIFKALRAVTSQSYIDASEFYNSILSSAQHVQNLAFTSSDDIETDRLGNSHEEISAFAPFPQKQPPRRLSSDLYNHELNQEAHRTAQQVYKSLQEPPASPLLLKDVDQQAYSSYLSDPSFTRTSEDIFNSLEHRRNSVQERLNGYQELLELQQEADSPQQTLSRRNSLDLFTALEESSLRLRLAQLFDECEFEQQQMANGSRRASLEPEPEPEPEPQLPPAPATIHDFASLQRAISCESVCSDTSVADLDIDTEEAPVVGLVCLGLEHDRWAINFPGESELTVSVLEARDLVTPDGRPAEDTFARVFLLPDENTHGETRPYKGTNSPSYQEKFYFPLIGGTLSRSVLVQIFSCEPTNREPIFLGEARLRLGPVPRPPATTWLQLVNTALPVAQLGELMFSLSYLPTAERLTLVVVKARNLKGANETPGDFFVKVYLLQQGKKLHKKRTSIKRGEKSPIFNEAIIFSVPSHTLQNIQLRLTVAEVNGDLSAGTKAFSVGHVIVGATTTGRSLTHWRQMLAALRRPVAMWHPLRK